MTEQHTYRRILVSPLNWGLGHATRLIPVVDALLKEGHYVLLGGESPALNILRQTFPKLDWVILPGFNVKLSKRNHQWLKLLTQTPALISATVKEYKTTQAIIKAYNINLIISDNRYGVRSQHIPSVILTHQTTPYIGKHLSLFRPLSNWISQRWIKRFDECWIPDNEGENNLSGTLSKPIKGIPCKYIGILSRLSLTEASDLDSKPDILIILSGPEPQRTQLEEILIRQFKDSKQKCILLNGRPDEKKRTIGNIEVLPHCSAEEQKSFILNSWHIICRSGYSTLMDLLYCRRTALLIPTPGQFEQEYLAHRAAKLMGFSFIEQHELVNTSIEKVIDKNLIHRLTGSISGITLPKLPQ